MTNSLATRFAPTRPMHSAEIITWVKSALDSAGISYAAASRKLGIPVDGISKVIRGTRDLTIEEMAALAEMTKTKVPVGNLATGPTPRYVNIVGEVAAGLWREVSSEQRDSQRLLALIDQRWPDEALFALTVVGESINERAADGDHVVCLAVEFAPRDLQSGDWVVVDRIRHDLRERTVKQARATNSGAWQLWPRSSHPDHKTPLRLGEHEGDRVEIVGYVLDFVSPGVRF